MPQTKLSAFRTDLESRVGITAGSATAVKSWFAGTVAIVITVAFFAVIFFLPNITFRADDA